LAPKGFTWKYSTTMKSLSWVVGGRKLSARVSWSRTSHWCHESFKNEVVILLQTCQKAWSRIKEWIFLETFHIKEPRVLLSHLIRWFSAMLGAYFFLQSLARKSWGCLSHLHQILTLRTLFRVVGSLSPRTPHDFGLHNFSQLMRDTFFLIFTPCYKLFLCKVLMAFRMKLRDTKAKKE
jgi:hypothetical protein